MYKLLICAHAVIHKHTHTFIKGGRKSRCLNMVDSDPYANRQENSPDLGRQLTVCATREKILTP